MARVSVGAVDGAGDLADAWVEDGFVFMSVFLGFVQYWGRSGVDRFDDFARFVNVGAVFFDLIGQFPVARASSGVIS